MSKNPYDLPKESLASIDHEGRRLFLYPAKVRGYFHSRREIVHALLMVIFLVLPWIRVGGHQAVLLDLPHRRFALFGLTFWAHDAPLIFFVLAALVLGLAFATALWGRVWCGWACPQTVFADFVFRRVESWVEGNHIQRRKRNEGSLSVDKIWRKSLKWSIYLGLSLIITHSFLAYFVGTDRLAEMVTRPPQENWSAFVIILVTTGLVLFDFGWFREQFCIIMCPYGRIQSVLMDEDSLTVSYDARRGEPRKGSSGSDQGDCINCFKCVAVCPTGIDIRRGMQMECIACTACIDACDEVMTKVKKPKGLIRYTTENLLNENKRPRWFRPRTLIYMGLLTTVLLGLTLALYKREPLHLSLVRAIETPYREINDTQIVNHFKLALKNHEFETVRVDLLVPDEPEIELVLPGMPLPVAGGDDLRKHLFIKFPRRLTAGSGKALVKVVFRVRGPTQNREIQQTMTLIGPS